MKNKEEITSNHCKLCLVKCSDNDVQYSEYEKFCKLLNIHLNFKEFPMKICTNCIKTIIRLTCFRKRVEKTNKCKVEGKCYVCQIEIRTTDICVKFLKKHFMTLLENHKIALENWDDKICADCVVDLKELSRVFLVWKNTIRTLAEEDDNLTADSSILITKSGK